MPASFSPTNLPANPVVPSDRIPSTRISPAAFLGFVCPHHNKKIGEILQSSLEDESLSSLPTDGARTPRIIPRKDGLVGTVLQAYSRHHALIIRPDDVWLAILTQFSFFVNRNAESLRSHFVRHQGKKTLVVDTFGSRHTVDYGSMARAMTTLIRQHISDLTLCDWILPDFTTTTSNDTTVASVIAMATLKSYFTYQMRLLCGIPRITLDGEQADWQKILDRLERLKRYGVQTIAWYHLLHPVVSRFVAAFDDPNGRSNVEFWQKMARRENMGSGGDILSGWITAFCVFSCEGEWLGDELNQEIDPSVNLASLSAHEFWSVSSGPTSPPSSETNLVLDQTKYHILNTDKIPNSWAEVDAELDDNGTAFRVVLTAGLLGSRIASSGDSNLSPLGENDTLQTLPVWWMFTPTGMNAG